MRGSREHKWMAAPAAPPVVVLAAGLAGPRPARRARSARGADAGGLRNHVVRRLERAAVGAGPAARAALLTFVIVGAGATGVEMGGALAEFRRRVVPRDYRTVDPAALRLVVLEAGEHVLPPYPPALRQRARRDLQAFGVAVRTGRRRERRAA